MKGKTKIKSLEMVRRIRDEMAKDLRGKSHTEIIEFFRNAGTRSRKGRRPHGSLRSQDETHG